VELLEARDFERHPARAASSGALGIASAVFLAASIQRAHHWGPLADLLVVGWAVATLGAIGISLWTLKTTVSGRRLERLGLVLGSFRSSRSC
jgi:hypothetical protein